MSEQNYDQVICPDCNHQFTAVPVNVQERIAELEAENAKLREAVDEVLNASVSALNYRSDRMQRALWDLRAVRDKALLQESKE